MKRVAVATIVILALLFTSLASGETSVVGNLELKVFASLAPKRLPREREAPVSVSVGWNIAGTDASVRPPTLKAVSIEINREGRLSAAGLPICPYQRIQPASTARALSNCRTALVGKGTFSAQVGLEGQESYISKGKMLVFNGSRGGKPVLYGHIYTGYPFAASFVIIFKIKKSSHGTYGTSLSAKMPANLRDWGNLTDVQMRLSRNYHVGGKSRSFLNGSCPAPKGFGQIPFPLARTSFSFVGGPNISSTLEETCKVRR